MAEKLHERRRPAKAYHHGNLVEALIAATIEIIQERGVEQLSVREVAKRAGVSPGAPFRHFRSKTALLTAVAEQAMDRLTRAVAKAQSEVGSADPCGRFRSDRTGLSPMGDGQCNAFPDHKLPNADRLRGIRQSARSDRAIRETMIDLLAQAQQQGRLASGHELDHLVLAARA